MKTKIHPYLSIIHRIILIVFVFSAALLPLCASARPVSESEVRTMAANWLAENDKPMGEAMGTGIREVIRYQGEIAGDIGYYLVLFSPNGWLIVPADDRYWPTMTFGGGQMTRENYEKSPWYQISRFNMSQNVTFSLTRMTDNSMAHAQKRWGNLLNIKPNLRRGLFPPNDVRVKPLLKTYWNQGHPYNNALNPSKLFQKYPFAFWIHRNKDITPFPVGCVTVAVGQGMHYFMTGKYYNVKLRPKTTLSMPWVVMLPPITTGFFAKINDFSPNWGKMPFMSVLATNVPIDTPDDQKVELAISQMRPPGVKRSDLSTNPVEALNEINSLFKENVSPFLRDLGFLLSSTYSGTGTSVSTHISKIDSLFYNYGFSNAILLYSSIGAFPGLSPSIPVFVMENIVRSNLDLKHPVILSGVLDNPEEILFPSYHHAVVVDGYGFERPEGNAYYHINMGYSGSSNAWSYELKQIYPNGSLSDLSFKSYAMLYNIFPIQPKPNSGSFKGGEIVSGRIVRDKKVFPAIPISGVFVRASWNNNFAYSITSTDEKGIYAFVVPSNTEIKVDVLDNDGNPNVNCMPQQVKTKKSERDYFPIEYLNHDAWKVGNIWGVDFELQNTSVALLYAQGQEDNIASVLDSMDIPYTPLSLDTLANLNTEETPVLLIEGQNKLHDGGQADSEAIADSLPQQGRTRSNHRQSGFSGGYAGYG